MIVADGRAFVLKASNGLLAFDLRTSDIRHFFLRSESTGPALELGTHEAAMVRFLYLALHRSQVEPDVAAAANCPMRPSAAPILPSAAPSFPGLLTRAKVSY